MPKYRVVRFVLLLAGLTVCAGAQHAQPTLPWWVGMDLGYGNIRFGSDQAPGTRQGTFALGLMGGRSLGSRARIGLELNGWLQHAYNLHDPAVGESVSNALCVLDAFPVANAPVFVRVGAGIAIYTNNRPTASGSQGWSWTAGLGYEIRLSKALALVPVIDYAVGRLGSAQSATPLETGRHYSVVEGKAGTIWSFGRR